MQYIKLKLGGYIEIIYTNALIVLDIITQKTEIVNKNNKDSNAFLKNKYRINGLVVIDFINMSNILENTYRRRYKIFIF